MLSITIKYPIVPEGITVNVEYDNRPVEEVMRDVDETIAHLNDKHSPATGKRNDA